MGRYGLFIFNLIIFDEIKFEIESNCNIEFSYGFSHLLVYQSYCNSNNIYQVEIDEVQYQFKSINKLEVEDIKNSSNQKLIQIDMCEKKRIYLIYEKLILSYDMEDIKYEENYYDINATILKTFQACLGVKSVLDVKDYTQYIQKKYIFIIIEDQFKFIEFKSFLVCECIYNGINSSISFQ